jgi:hypothetical protein
VIRQTHRKKSIVFVGKLSSNLIDNVRVKHRYGAYAKGFPFVVDLVGGLNVPHHGWTVRRASVNGLVLDNYWSTN